MKKLIGSFLVLFTCLSVQAQPPAGMGKSDPEAKKILDAVSQKFKTYKSVQAKFILKIENAAGKNLGNKNGTVYMKGTKYRISAPGQDIFSDGNNVWTYEKSSNEVTISRIDPAANSITPQKLFTNFYDKDFLYKLNGVVKMNGKNMQEIELTPIDKTKAFHKVLLYIDKSVIYTTKVFEKSGNRYTYSVSNMATNGAIADPTFVFDAAKYPGVEVVDLR
ncbi:MAG TPA: outer membrane lipoprotein carrier protein LolA [Chitinophagaceae bacterium]|nr:outer membrane lipoprotein carrier protein LolA [Chitinophagaceae bacterium]HRF26449.1 outer membrane lipoprotein carrier protein LolA [Ferruginibacter sp.]